MMSFISKDSIHEVEVRGDIVKIVGEYVSLTPRGSSFWGCCPFHNEKTPSFCVSPDIGKYHCFGCNVGGSIINFIQEIEKISFPEAVEFIAKKSGIQLVYEDGGKQNKNIDPLFKKKDEYIELYTRVSTTFHYMLMKTDAGKFAYDYIKSRGLTDETLEKFKLGYSPLDRKWLKNFLIKKNYTNEFLTDSGLFSKKYPDMAFFSDRLMFPIFDKNGKVVAMGGRFLRGDSEKSPKYLNSGDLVQYKKGETLYAFNFAKKAIRENKKVIFCEGYMDCIAYHQCGIEYAVAPLGTALTVEQIKLVKNFVDTIYLSFDSDSAGQKAAERAIYMCRKEDENISVKIIKISDGKDPAEIMLKFGGKVLTQAVENSILDIDFILSKLRLLYPDNSPEAKSRAALAFFVYIDSLQSSVRKTACLEQFSKLFGIKMEALERDYFNRKKITEKFKAVESKVVAPDASRSFVKVTDELRAVMAAVNDDVKYFDLMRSKISSDDIEDSVAKSLFLTMIKCADAGTFSFLSIMEACESEGLKQMLPVVAKEYCEKPEKSVNDSIKFLKRRSLERKQREIQAVIEMYSKSVSQQDQERVESALAEKNCIDLELLQYKE